MREIGGYIELDSYFGKEYHNKGIALNCARNCLAYLIQTCGIKKIYLPVFLCDSVENVCKKYNVKIEYYNINQSFYPIFEKYLNDNEYLYIVNYYGQLSNSEIIAIKNKYENIIVDNAQSFFQMPVDGVDTIYTCRKFFGVADGAYLYTDAFLENEIETDVSYSRMHFLLGRFEKGANEFYDEYVLNNKHFSDEPIKKMSALTKNLLKAIDYERVKNIRTDNFLCLSKYLGNINQLNLNIPDGAFMYPLYLKNGSMLRKQLQKMKIYVPTLWPNVVNESTLGSTEYDYAKNILPLPCDQRYSKEDMYYMANIIKDYIKKEGFKY